MAASFAHRWAALIALLLVASIAAALPPPARSAIVAPAKPDRHLSQGLLQLHREYLEHQRRLRDGAAMGPFRPSSPLARVAGDRVVIDAIAADPQRLLADLQALGLERGSAAGFMVSGRLPIAAIPALAGLDSLVQARVSAAATSRGSTTSQADQAMAVAAARSTFGLDGSGVTVGTLSDSYGCDASASTTPAQDVASGDLPADVQVLRDYTDSDCIDEGRAMMQLIHDLAPGAKQQFYTAFEGQAGFANGIRALAAAGSTVIVDDIIYFAEPMFQDGVIAQAVDDVAADGALYFSSAGNNGRSGYGSPLRLAEQITIDGSPRDLHDFDPGPGVDSYLRLELAPFDLLILIFQWDDPFGSVSGAPGAANDLDIYIVPPSGSLAEVAQQGNDDNIGGDPVEIAAVFNNSFTPQPVDLVVAEYQAGQAPATQIQIVAFGEWQPLEHNASGPTVYGHANARGAVAVGAAAFFGTPAFGQSPPLLNDYSSGGPTPIYFDPAGRRLAAAELRRKPEITAVDGTNTTFFGNDIPEDADSFPNFFGTSAAAPHAAAVAALLRQGDPTITLAETLALLQETAIDMGQPGFDDDSGAGLIQANAAIGQLFAADLGLTGRVSPFATPSSTLTYTLTLANAGPNIARGATLTQTLPAGASLIAATATAGSCAPAAGQVVCAVGDIAAGGIVTSTVSVTTPASGTLSSSATVAARGPDPLPANNTANLSTTIVPPESLANLSLSGSASDTSIDAGDPVTYTLTVANAGPATARAVTLTVSLPPEATLLSGDGAGWDCQPGGASLVCTRSDLGVATAPPVSVALRAPPDGARLRLTAEVTSTEPSTSGDSARVSLTTAVFGRRYLPLLYK